MVKKTVKNCQIVPLSLGAETVQRLNDILTDFQKWKYATMLKSASRSELAEICMVIGLDIVDEVRKTENWNSLPKIVKEKPYIAKREPDTISDLTDEDIKALED